MSIRTSHFLVGIALSGIFIALFTFAAGVHASPLHFPATFRSATATTTVTYMGTGTASTTLVTADTYSQNGTVGGGGSTSATDKAALNIQFAASSTSSVLYLTLEHSQDGIDWYQDDTIVPVTVGYNAITNPEVYSWTAAGTATSSKTILVPTPERYVRARIWMSGAAGAVWGEFVGQKQDN